MALLERDVTDKVRRALLRKAPTVTAELVPGTRVYFWSAHPTKGRQRQDAERWRGPATVIAKEAHTRYYLSWRGQVLLVAREQLRLVTSLEASSAKHVREDVAITAGKDDKRLQQHSRRSSNTRHPRKQEDK